MISRFRIFTTTIFNLSFNQFLFRSWYLVKRTLNSFLQPKPLNFFDYPKKLKLKKFKANYIIYDAYQSKVKFDKGQFEFKLLKTKINFDSQIEWNAEFLNTGTRLLKLHLHNQNYLIPLALTNSESDKKVIKLIINSWINSNNYINTESYKGPWNSYCTSNRIISYLITDAIIVGGLDKYIDKFPSLVIGHYKHIRNNLEYDIKGNHLLENYIALCFCSIYLEWKDDFERNFNLLTDTLKIQILNDGAHYELSSMYHTILTNKLLDLSNYILNNQYYCEIKKKKLESYCYRMIKWHETIQLNSSTPLLNDAFKSEIVSLKKLISIYQLIFDTPFKLKKKYSLYESGFRRFVNKNYETLIKIGNIGARETPGHAHADTFNTLLSYENGMVFIDPGASTYNNNKQRCLERSTEYHNTVSIKNLNSSEVWSSFRVGRQCKTQIITDNSDYYKAKHNGYKNIKITHYREWSFKESKIIIKDSLEGNSKREKGIQNWVLDPQRNIQLKANIIFIDDIVMKFHGEVIKINIEEITIPSNYNIMTTTNRIRISFLRRLTTEIIFK